MHRDVKPSNLLVTEENGREAAKLADFGLARLYQSSELSGLTLMGDVGGSASYVAPEQITNFRETQPPADQYATAATLYHLLTRQYVYDRQPTNQEQFRQVLTEDPVPIERRRPDLPEPLIRIIHRALLREPRKRFPDVAALRDVLAPYCAD